MLRGQDRKTEELLGREPIHLNNDIISDYIKGKTVCTKRRIPKFTL